MHIARHIVLALIVLAPLSLSATTFTVDSSATLSSLSALISQYETRIKQLESENTILRNEMAKAGIKIPLGDYSGALLTLPPTPYTSTSIDTTTIKSDPPSSTLSGSTQTGANQSVVSGESASLAEITTKYGRDVSGFISQIHMDWNGIKDYYKIPNQPKIAGYEFVQTGSRDHVFVDIVMGTGSAGNYDMKILYQYDKTTFKRKLIGMFRFDAANARYTTVSGINPFAGTVRTFVKDPYYTGTAIPPPTAGGATSTGTTQTGVTIPSSSPVVGTVSLADITKAYTEKKYLSTITLSNSYLEKNPATAEILNIRYRTFFIIGKYAESLAEVAKIESLGALDRQTACNAQVIATYNKNTTLVNKYTAVCKK